ncbi:MAG: glycosyltransferase family 39 protein [Dehalococcoidia bacterium]
MTTSALTRAASIPRDAAVRRFIVAELLFLVAFLLYVRSFDAWFIILDFNHFDAIRSTPAGTFFLRIFDPSDGGQTVVDTGNLYRPVYYTSMWLEYQLFGRNPLPYYITSAALHGANTVLVWFLARRVTRSELAAGFAGLIWALQPTFADAVAWVSSITDLLLVLFTVSAVLLYANALEAEGRPRWRLYAGSLACAILALGAKEPGVAVAPLLLGYHVLLGEPDIIRKRQVPWLVLPFFAIIVLYFVLRYALVGNLASQDGSTQLSFDLFRNVHRLSSIAVVPFLGESQRQFVLGQTQGILGLVLIAITLVAFVFGSRGERFAVWWWFAGLGPFLTLVPLFLVGRYFYLGFIGLAILAGSGIDKLAQLSAGRAPQVVRVLAGAALATGLIVWLGWLNFDHQDSLNGRGEEAQAFVEQLQAAYPSLPADAFLVVAEYPETLAFGGEDDGFMMRHAVRLVYHQDIDVMTWRQFLERTSRGEIPPREEQYWFPPQPGTAGAPAP